MGMHICSDRLQLTLYRTLSGRAGGAPHAMPCKDPALSSFANSPPVQAARSSTPALAAPGSSEAAGSDGRIARHSMTNPLPMPHLVLVPQPCSRGRQTPVRLSRSASLAPFGALGGWLLAGAASVEQAPLVVNVGRSSSCLGRSRSETPLRIGVDQRWRSRTRRRGELNFVSRP
jgi:hypothetical protein